MRAASILAEMAAPLIANLEKLLGTPRDGALLRYSLGTEYLKAGEVERAISELREAVARDPRYSAAWKALGGALVDAGRDDEALAAFTQGTKPRARKATSRPKGRRCSRAAPSGGA